MKQFVRRFATLLALPGLLLLTGCSTSGGGSGGSANYGVYGGYGYPYYRYGYDDCCYGDRDYDREDVQERRQDRRENISNNPNVQPGSRPSGSMGRPSGMQMSRPARRAGGGRRR